ncbi:MAG: Rne/Rng family ribonuclease [Magnetococcales bacterium]|nr:Rne/Rng family ribonuclease [Magnetococcales bacterium]
MTKRMLVDATHPEEVRVAILQDQRLSDLDIETSAREQIKGNIYLAKVSRVEPSLQAAFVDYNGGRQGFLSVNDIHTKYYPKEFQDEKPPHSDVNQDEGLESSQPTDEADGQESTTTQSFFARRRVLPIQKLLTRNQVILVQVVKEARGNKGASLTTNISLAGRYTVLLPENSGGGGISRKIIDPQERKNLKELMAGLDIPSQVSLIIRTAGLGRTKREIMRDMSYLLRLWNMIQEKAANSTAPSLIHEEGDLIMRTIRDLYTTDMEEILIEGQDAYRNGKDFMRLLMPRYVKVVQPYKENIPIFSRFQVESQIESMHERVIQLKSGGYLVIDATEALVAIDINSGRSTREKDVESTAFKTNLQAAEEIARQLRLRDIGGLIIIDFIDMEDKKHNAEVEKRLKESFKLDRAKVQIGRISQFGLLELSRQRIKPAFSETSSRVCPRCQGIGTIRSVESASIHLLRRLEEEVCQGRYDRICYYTSPEVANYLLNQKREQLLRLEEIGHVQIVIQADAALQTPEMRKEHVERPKHLIAAIQIGYNTINDGDEPDEIEEDLLDDEDEEDGPYAAPSRSADDRDQAETATVQTGDSVSTPLSSDENGERKRRRRRRRRSSSSNRPDTIEATAPDKEAESETAAADGPEDLVESSTSGHDGDAAAVTPPADGLPRNGSKSRPRRRGTRSGPRAPAAQAVGTDSQPESVTAEGEAVSEPAAPPVAPEKTDSVNRRRSRYKRPPAPATSEPSAELSSPTTEDNPTTSDTVAADPNGEPPVQRPSDGRRPRPSSRSSRPRSGYRSSSAQESSLPPASPPEAVVTTPPSPPVVTTKDQESHGGDSAETQEGQKKRRLSSAIRSPQRIGLRRPSGDANEILRRMNMLPDP